MPSGGWQSDAGHVAGAGGDPVFQLKGWIIMAVIVFVVWYIGWLHGEMRRKKAARIAREYEEKLRKEAGEKECVRSGMD